MAPGFLARTLALASLGACSFLVLGERSAAAGSPSQGIWGGEPVELCALPTVVWLPHSGCSGVLVSPRLVLTAGHCVQGLDPPTVVFGEDLAAPARSVDALRCVANPSWSGLVDAEDFGYCLLGEAVELPIVPVVAACEAPTREPGTSVLIAGFGEDEQGASGRKRAVELELTQVDAGLLALGGAGLDSCLGDSGGPVMLALEDGGWRVVGLIVGGGSCGEGGFAVDAGRALDWALADAGIELGELGETPIDPRSGASDPGLAWAQGCPSETLALERCDAPATAEPGCACRSDRAPRSGGWGWLALVVSYGWWRRRRATTAP